MLCAVPHPVLSVEILLPAGNEVLLVDTVVPELEPVDVITGWVCAGISAVLNM